VWFLVSGVGSLCFFLVVVVVVVVVCFWSLSCADIIPQGEYVELLVGFHAPSFSCPGDLCSPPPHFSSVIIFIRFEHR